MHFKRYNLVIISSEWIGAASHYTQLKSEITRRILTTSTEQSVLTFFSTSNSIFIGLLLQNGLLSLLSFFSEDLTLPLIAFDTYPLSLVLRRGKTLVVRCRSAAGYPFTIPGRIITSLFHYLSNTAFYFNLYCYFWTALICLMCILFNRIIQIKTVLRLNLSIELIVCQYRTDAVRVADIVLIEMKIILLDLFLN